MAHLYAGTSGFAYPAWKPRFYPEKLAQSGFLGYYSSRLNAVEINYTFRQNPSAKTVEGWIGATQPGFVFCLKAHQRITHILRLRNAADATGFFLRQIDPLRVTHRLGVVLFQLPPNFKADTALLEEFLSTLPEGVRYAFEFRHLSWQNEAIYQALARRNCCFCLAESDKLEAPDVLTADFVYFRLRKPDYPPEERQTIAERVRELLDGGRTVYLFFKHEDTPEGAFYAEELLDRTSAGPAAAEA